MNAAQRTRALERLDLLVAEIRASHMQAKGGAHPDIAAGFVGTMQVRLERWEREIGELRSLLAPPKRLGGLGKRPTFGGPSR